MSKILVIVLCIDLIVGLIYWTYFIDAIGYYNKEGLTVVDILLQILFLPVSIVSYVVILIVYSVTKFIDLIRSKSSKSMLTKVIIKFKLM